MDDKSDVSHLANTAAPNDAERASLPAPEWFVSLCAAVTDSLAPVVMIGATRSGKTRLATALQAAVVEQGVTISIIERQKAEGGVAAGAHLVVFRQSQYEDAAVISAALKKEFTPDELLALPRWKAAIRLADDSKSVLVDTNTLYLSK